MKKDLGIIHPDAQATPHFGASKRLDRAALAKIADGITVTEVKRRQQAGGLDAILHSKRHRPEPLFKPHARSMVGSFWGASHPLLGFGPFRTCNISLYSLELPEAVREV